MIPIFAAALIVCAQIAEPKPPAPPKVLGPLVCAAEATRLNLWCRVEAPARLTLYAFDKSGTLIREVVSQADESHDQCVTFRLTDLAPGQRLSYLVLPGDAPKDKPTINTGGVTTITLPSADPTSSATIIFGSCAMDAFDQPQQVWSTMREHRPTALCLIGDTPYIDSPKLETQRKRYRQFYAVPEFLTLRRTTPTFAIWDDHDFGENDTSGKMPGKDEARRAFDEYHGNFTLGEGETGRGIYHSFRQGPVEVFMLDARWYSNTEPSFADPSKPTLIGSAQWSWLKAGLKSSTAPVKLLVTGMVWNDAVRIKKSDYWGAYTHERDAVLKFIEAEKISGVMLVGGDVHRSRSFRHGTEWSGVSYPIYELVASPLGSSIHQAAMVGDPDLLADRGAEKSFCVVRATPIKDHPEKAMVEAAWRTAAGDTLFRWSITTDELQPGADMTPAATKPQPRPDEWWTTRHRVQTEALRTKKPAVVFIGDSITQGWEGASAWARFADHAVNLGFSGDQTQHVIERLDRGSLDAMRDHPPKAIVLLIGTNNTPDASHTPRDIAAGVSAIVRRLEENLPQTRILLMNVFPRSPAPDGLRLKIEQVNRLIAPLASARVKIVDIGAQFLDEKGLMNTDLMPDTLHLSPKGYELWADAIEPTLNEWMK